MLESLVDNEFNWGSLSVDSSEDVIVTKEDIINYKLNESLEITDVYSNLEGTYPKDKLWHMGRVIYFVNRPADVVNIEVIDEGDDFLLIGDGNHRLLAAFVLKELGLLSIIDILFTGQLKRINHLLV